jgi:hypothetical protein
MKKLLFFVLALALIFTISCSKNVTPTANDNSGTVSALSHRLSSNNRRAVVLETFYALRPSYDGGCDRTLNGNCISTWNYMNYDSSSYTTVKGWYSCNSSDWAVSTDSCPNLTGLTIPSFYSNVSGYGYSTIGIPYALFGRGAQCVFFCNLVLYRSGSHTSCFPSLATMNGNSEPNLQKVVEGDILQRYNDGSNTNHVAIVVQIYKSGSTVTSIDVIDSNWLSESGAANHEIIGRHNFVISTIQGHFHIWKGTAYYNEPYTP